MNRTVSNEQTRELKLLENAEPVRRTSEIEEITNLYFIHPIANRLTALFAKMHIHPNAVSIAGMVFGVMAGIAYRHYQDLRYAIAGFVLMIAWHVMDGADGQLARLTHRQSQSGKVLDGVCDYITFIAVYAGLALTLSRQHGVWIWALVVVAGACHAVQATAYDAQRQEYNFWGWGIQSAELLEAEALPRRAKAPSLWQLLSDLIYRQYANIQFLGAGVTLKFHKKLAAAVALRPQNIAFIRRRYREVFAPTVRRWSIMSPNYRTLGIFICALFKTPQYYFWIEAVGLSVILIILLFAQRVQYAQFLKSLDITE